jgi:hypothetical protein
LRELNPDKRIYTFWKYFRNAFARDAGLRIDHFLLSPAVAKRLTAAGVNRDVRSWEKTSDHAPVWIELRAAANPRNPTALVSIGAELAVSDHEQNVGMARQTECAPTGEIFSRQMKAHLLDTEVEPVA